MGRQGAHSVVREEKPKDPNALPVNFGKKLAHTDKVVRDRGFRILKKWLKNNTELERLEYMKLWKGLYFGMWMADKRLVQQDLAVSTALLINDIPDQRHGLWIECFWHTMQDHFENLDYHRISKFLLFVRINLAEIFKSLRCRGWPGAEVRSAVLTFFGHRAGSISKAMPCFALISHFARVFWSEVTPQLEAEPAKADAAMKELLGPWCQLAATTTSETLIKSIHENVLVRVPDSIVSFVVEGLIVAASKPEISKRNREAMYETADVLEKKTGIVVDRAALAKKGAAGRGSRAVLELPGAVRQPGAASKRRSKRKKGDTSTNGRQEQDGEEDEQEKPYPGMSPLMLPRSAVIETGKRKQESVASSPASATKAADANEALRKKRRKRSSAKAGAESPALKATSSEMPAKKRRKKKANA